jgi:hypothetical protein
MMRTQAGTPRQTLLWMSEHYLQYKLRMTYEDVLDSQLPTQSVEVDDDQTNSPGETEDVNNVN